MLVAYAIVALLVAACAVLTDAMLRARKASEAALAKNAQLTAESAALQRLLAVRDEQGQQKDEFISTVSHELRTPLTSIRGALGLLSTMPAAQADPKSLNLLRIASSNTDRLVRLINDILDLERMDSGKAPLQMYPCALRELVGHACDTMHALAADAGIRIEQVPDAEVIAVEADPDRIQQVLCNLLSNAIKFSPPGSVVRLFSGVDGGSLVLCVEDSGRGIPADRLESVFDRFQQLELSDARSKGGSGLGLAICRSIIQQHGGTIHAVRNDSNSPSRPGTTFVIRMPRIATVEDLLTVSAIHRRPRVQLPSVRSLP